MEFDTTRARRAGHSEASIADTLARARGFDVGAARDAGYSDGEIIARLQEPTNSTAAVGANAFGRGLSAIAGLPGTLADAAGSVVSAGYRAVTGRDVPLRGNPLSTESIQGGLRTAGVLDRPGTEPQSPFQRRVAATMEGAGAGLPFGPASAALGAVGGWAGEEASDLATDAGYGEGVQTGARLAANVGGGMAAGALARGAGRVIAPVRNAGSPERQALVQAAEREGLAPTPAQRTGNRVLANVEEAFVTLPTTTGREVANRTGQQTAFTQAALQRAGLTGTRLTPTEVVAAERAIGGEIGAIAARNRANFGGNIANDLTALAQDAAANGAGDVPRLIQNRVMEILGKLNAGDEMAGSAWRELDTAIGRQIRNNPTNGDLRRYLGDLRTVMGDALEAGGISADDLAALRTARRNYANLMVLEDAVGRAGSAAAEGAVTPAALRGALAANVGRRGYAQGRGDLNELARVGEAVVRPTIPNSGTAERALTLAALSAPGAIFGSPAAAVAGAAGPWLAQRAYYSPLGRAYLAPPEGARAAVVNALPGVLQGAAAGGLAFAPSPDAARLSGR